MNKSIVGICAIAILIFGLSKNSLAMQKQPLFSIFEVARQGKYSLIKEYLEKGGDANACDNTSHEAYKAPLLIYAASMGHLNIVKLLLAHKADINMQNKLGRTALSYAAHNEQEEVLLFLLEAGARTDIPCKLGYLPLEWLKGTGKGNTQAAAILRKAKAGVLYGQDTDLNDGNKEI